MGSAGEDGGAAQHYTGPWRWWKSWNRFCQCQSCFINSVVARFVCCTVALVCVCVCVRATLSVSNLGLTVVIGRCVADGHALHQKRGGRVQCLKTFF